MTIDETKQWDEDTVCPICLEHPHNAILLVCSSYDKGCRLFMCDTSSCFQRFRKSSRKEDEGEDLSNSKLLCPLCRGSICRSTVVESARNSMNAKPRSCEACDFSSTYEDLRTHMSSMHPLVRVRPPIERLEVHSRDLISDLESEMSANNMRASDMLRQGRAFEYWACLRRNDDFIRRLQQLEAEARDNGDDHRLRRRRLI